MIIGIVSKEDHCQSHVKGLTRDGFEVRVLGGDPTPIPPSVKILVVRTQSCSHAASSAAFQWGRQPGNVLIVENGLSGIRRKLAEIALVLEVAIEQEAIQAKRAEARASMGGPAPLIVGLALDGILPPPLPQPLPASRPVEVPLATTKEASVATYSFLLPPNWPHTLPWTNAISKERLSREVSAADTIFRSLDPAMAENVADSFENLQINGEFFKTTLARHPKFHNLKSKPLQWLALILFCTKPGSTHDARRLMEAYYLFNDGKATNLQTTQAVAWATSRHLVISLPTMVKAASPEPAPLRPAEPRPEVQQAVLTHLREENEALKRTNAVLAKKVESLEAFEGWMRAEFASLTAGLREFNRGVNDRIETLESVDLTERISKGETAAKALLERVEELETRPLPVAPPAPPVKATDSLLDALDAIRSRGGDVTISLGRSKS